MISGHEYRPAWHSFICIGVVTLTVVWNVSTLTQEAHAQNADLSFLVTAPERTDFNETTRYNEAMAFLKVASAQHPLMHLTSFGYTTEGRAMPLVVYGDVMDASPEAVRASGKMPIYIQGNIHAGEVCGKEALLMLSRALASGEHASWADSLVLLIAPIYNSDGNERVNLFNRPRQNGPLAGMGQRPNAQGLDLNRDHMKVKSSEARALISLMNEYDPLIAVDLHTTNGTRHGYHLTYSPALNPNTDAGIDSLLRQVLLPAVTTGIKDRTGWDYYYYGNLPFRRGDPGWYTFDHRPRFNNNYIGLRNRIPILSEAYSYASFEDRILASLYFVEGIVEYAMAHTQQIKDVVEAADAAILAGTELGVRFEASRSSISTDILMGEVLAKTNPYSGATYFDRVDTTYVMPLPEFGTFEAVETSRLPRTYWVSADAAQVVGAYLQTHGIQYSRLNTEIAVRADVFVIDSTRVAEREFQQINERTIWGSYSPQSIQLRPGALSISTNQPLARLLFYLLEPRSDDGLVNWGQMEDWTKEEMNYPVFRSMQ